LEMFLIFESNKTDEDYEFDDFLSTLKIKQKVGSKWNADFIFTEEFQDLNYTAEALGVDGMSHVFVFDFQIVSTDMLYSRAAEAFETFIFLDTALWTPLTGDPILFFAMSRTKIVESRSLLFRYLWGKETFPSYLHLELSGNVAIPIQYTERVVHRLDGSTEHYFSVSRYDVWVDITDYWERTYGSVTIVLFGDLSVEHWKEYLEYGYIDWFVGMGGMITFAITAFVFVASKIPSAVNDQQSTGVLAKILLLYKLKEIVMILMKSKDSYKKRDDEEDGGETFRL